jgi:hypothetical protein
MTYVAIYNTGEVSCQIGSGGVFYDFLSYVTTKDKYPVAVLKIRRKFRQMEIKEFLNEEGEMQNSVLSE